MRKSYRQQLIDYRDELDELEDNVRSLFHSIESIQKNCEDIHSEICRVTDKLTEAINEENDEEDLVTQEQLQKVFDDFIKRKKNEMREKELIGILNKICD